MEQRIEINEKEHIEFEDEYFAVYSNEVTIKCLYVLNEFYCDESTYLTIVKENNVYNLEFAHDVIADNKDNWTKLYLHASKEQCYTVVKELFNRCKKFGLSISTEEVVEKEIIGQLADEYEDCFNKALEFYNSDSLDEIKKSLCLFEKLNGYKKSNSYLNNAKRKIRNLEQRQFIEKATSISVNKGNSNEIFNDESKNDDVKEDDDDFDSLDDIIAALFDSDEDEEE